MVESSTVSPTNSLKKFMNRIQYVSYAPDSYANDLTVWLRRMLLFFTVQAHSTIANFMS